MNERFPGYDVLSKRAGLSWNDATRRAIDERLAVPREPRFFTQAEWAVLEAVCGRILPQPPDRPPIPIAALIDARLLEMGDSGTRVHPMPWPGEAWRRALAALEQESRQRHDTGFASLTAFAADALLSSMQHGRLNGPAWENLPSALFFAKQLLPDIVQAYYSHPTAWSEIGFGGPASPRGYVRMEANRADPWEAAEAGADPARARRHNRHVA